MPRTLEYPLFREFKELRVEVELARKRLCLSDVRVDVEKGHSLSLIEQVRRLLIVSIESAADHSEIERGLKFPTDAQLFRPCLFRIAGDKRKPIGHYLHTC